MIPVLLFSELPAEEKKPIATLRPNVPSTHRFGASVAFAANAFRMVIGAPPADFDGNGSVHIFDFDRGDRGWTEQPFTPNTAFPAVVDNVAYNVTVLSLGSSVAISTDGESVIAGAPGTRFANESATLDEVGAVLIFQNGPSGWSQTLSVPRPLRAGGRFGALLDSSTDVKFYASAAAGDVFVAREDGPSWGDPAPLHAVNGTTLTSLEFADASTLLVGSSGGVSLYKRYERGWRFKQVNARGGYVEMPENDQFTIAVSANDTISFVFRNNTSTSWTTTYEVKYPDGAIGDRIRFCQRDFLAATAVAAGNRVVMLFVRGEDGKFEHKATIEHPSDRQNWSETRFASSLAWDDNRCLVLAVGAVSDVSGKSVVYLYEVFALTSRHPIFVQYRQAGVIMAVFVAALLLAVVVSAVVYLILRFRRGRMKGLGTGERADNLL
jgi:hypothetical protein